MIKGQRSLLPENGLALRKMLHVHELIVSYSTRATISLLAIATTDLSYLKGTPTSSDVQPRIPFKV